MLKATVVAAMLLLGTGAAEAQDCTLKRYDSIPMEVYPDHLVLPVSFGTTPKKLVFQLADAASWLNADTAAALDLRMRSLPTNLHYSRNGDQVTRFARVPELHLGKQVLNDMEFLELKHGQYQDGVVGDLGNRLFSNIDMELDIAGGKLNLFSPDHCPGKVVYWTKGDVATVPLKPDKDFGFLRAEVMIDGHPVTVALNTTGRSRIGMDAMRRIFDVDENSPALVAVSQDLLGHKLYRYPFKTLTADGLTISNPDILVFDEPPKPECTDRTHFEDPDDQRVHSTTQPTLARNFGCRDAILGLSVLSKLHIYVSRRENLLYLTAAGAK